MSVKGKHDKKSGRIRFEEWNLRSATFPQELIKELIQRVLKEGLELATEEYTVVAEFEPDKNDPSRFYVSLPIGDDGDEPRWFVSVTQLVNDFIEYNTTPSGFDEEDAPKAAKLRDHLRTLANLIEGHLPK